MKSKILLIAAGIAQAASSLSATAADSESSKHLFILSGQSNMWESMIGLSPIP